ncbi:MAG TPA: OmpW family protein [Beijerinckiaceae bacterium]|nr:OmpW family protein [Beijerinckiaceae bacterium]
MKRVLLAAASAAALLGSQAFAADAPMKPGAMPIEAFNPWMVRLRALAVVPQEDASLSTAAGPIIGGKVGISNSVVPELDITYFFNRNFAVELILGTTPHKVKGAGALAGVGPIGRAWLLPPTLTAQYHFYLTDSIKPYVGAGINYTIFYNEKSSGVFTGTKFDLKDTFGLAVQAGVDIMINKNWGFNVDVKKIWLEPNVSVGSGAVTGKVKIDPWLIGAGITYKF